MRRILKQSLDFNKKYVVPPIKKFVVGGLQSVKENLEIFYGPTSDKVLEGVDLSGKTCLVTGASSGIGLEAAKGLNSRGGDVITVCRNPYAAQAAASVCPYPERVYTFEANLASIRSVKACSDEICNNFEKIDILILNAGTFGLPWTLTEDGLETTFQVNYLSQFYLLMNLEEILAPDARVIFVTSESHRYVKWPMGHIQSLTEERLSLEKNDYTPIKAYNISKLCNILAMHYLGYRWLKTQKQVFSVHPGSFVSTRLCRNWWVYELIYTAMLPFSKNVNQAASTPLYCATSPLLRGQSAQYYKDCTRTQESHLAHEMRLAFQLNHITQNIIAEKTSLAESITPDAQQKYEEEDEQLVSSYSG